jgi:hypothetical protein
MSTRGKGISRQINPNEGTWGGVIGNCITDRHAGEDRNVETDRHENLKSHKMQQCNVGKYPRNSNPGSG